MDPNEALRLIRLTIKQMRVEDKTPIRESADLFAFVQHARDLAETVEGLDEWLKNDGFLPHDWVSEEDKPDDPHVDPDHRACLDAGEHVKGQRHRWQECPVYHEEN